jgi:hypothetical protein
MEHVLFCTGHELLIPAGPDPPALTQSNRRKVMTQRRAAAWQTFGAYGRFLSRLMTHLMGARALLRFR